MSTKSESELNVFSEFDMCFEDETCRFFVGEYEIYILQNLNYSQFLMYCMGDPDNFYYFKNKGEFLIELWKMVESFENNFWRS